MSGDKSRFPSKLSSSFVFLCALLLYKAFPSSLCVLPHGLPLQQCVALVIPSCLKQTDGIRESDGQFSQCMCRLVRFGVCVFRMHTCFSFLFPATTLSPSAQVFCMAGVVCVCVCVSVRTRAHAFGNYLTHRVSKSGAALFPGPALAILDARCQSGSEGSHRCSFFSSLSAHQSRVV